MTEIADKIFIVDGPIINFYGFPCPTRSVVVQLSNGDLWVWSPVHLSDEITLFVNRLGAVKHLVSPNKLHHLFIKQWQQAFPDAIVWGPKSTIRKCPELVFQPALDDQAPPSWRDEIAQFWFQGSLFLDEIVFFHKASRTAIFADLTMNFSQAFLEKNCRPWQRKLIHFAKMTEPDFFAPPEIRLTWFRKGAARKKLHSLLQMSPDKVVMAHGEWQSKNGRQYLENAFSWLL